MDSGEITLTARGLIPVLALAACGLVAAGGVAPAGVLNADVGVNPTYEQTDGTHVVSTGGFFSARAQVSAATDYTGGTLTYGGSGSPESFVYVPADGSWEAGGGAASLPALLTAFPPGPYAFDLTGGTDGPTTFTIDYAGSTYAENPPELTEASFDALQGMNAAASITLDFNSFVTTGKPSNSDITLTILDSTFTPVYFSGFLDSSATDWTIPGGTLLAGQSYTFDLLFSSQISGTNDSPSFGTTQFYDTHTQGAFTTAIPEPSTWAMLLTGFLGIGLILRRRGAIVAKSA